MVYRAIGLMSRVFANGPGNRGSIPGRVIPKTEKKIVLDATFLRYETIEEMKEAVTKVIDMLTQEDFHGALQKLLERYNKGLVFYECTINKSTHTEKVWKLIACTSCISISMNIYVYIYVYIYVCMFV